MQEYFEYPILEVDALHYWLCPVWPGLKRSQMAIYAGVRLFYKGLRSINFSDHILDSNSVADHPPASSSAGHQTPFRLIPVVVELRRVHPG